MTEETKQALLDICRETLEVQSEAIQDKKKGYAYAAGYMASALDRIRAIVQETTPDE